MASVDLNADLGEGFGRYRFPADEAILDIVSSANVACGFHAGDPVVIRHTVDEAARRGVAIGAHPGYPDLLGFGRRELAATPPEIEAYVIYQVGALQAFCTAAGTRLRFVKAHGALYNRAARDPAAADAIAHAVRVVDPGLAFLGLAGSELVKAARRAKLAVAEEAFIDRAYAADGTLLPRSHPGAVLHDPAVCVDRAARMVLDGLVEAVDGTMLPVRADSLCAHGDGPNAVELLTAVRKRLETAGVRIAAFAR
jgi:5-oxoprolinase (ATP-hydrolysing) subunit A